MNRVASSPDPTFDWENICSPQSALSSQEKNESPFFSIIIPVFNGENYISSALASVLSQDYAEIEILVVDDASTDATVDIVKQVSAGDERVRLLRHDTNKQLFEARRTGIHHARGSYILFLDADDELAPSICSTCRNMLIEEPCDILHFAIDPFVDGECPPGKLDDVRHYFTPYSGRLANEDIAHALFSKRLISWSVCAKCFKSDILKCAFEDLPEARLYYAEDAACSFAISYYARSYHGLPDVEGYRYRLDSGQSGVIGKRDSLEALEKVAAGETALDVAEAFYILHGEQKEYQVDYLALEDSLTYMCADRFPGSFSTEDLPKALTLMFALWRPYRIIAALARHKIDECPSIIASCHAAKCLTRKDEHISAIGVYVPMELDRDQLALLDRKVTEWRRRKFEVVYFTEISEQLFISMLGKRPRLLSKFKRKIVFLPNRDYVLENRNRYEDRSRLLVDGITRYHLNGFVYLGAADALSALDYLTIKCCGTAFSFHMVDMPEEILSENENAWAAFV